MLAGQRGGLLGALAGCLPVAAELVEPRGVEQGMRFAERLAEPAGQRRGVRAVPARPLRLPGELEGPGSVRERTDAGVVVAVQAGEGGVVVGIVERQRLGHVIGHGAELTAREPRRPQRVMRPR